MMVHLRQLTNKPLQKISCDIDLALVNKKTTPEFTRTIPKATPEFQKAFEL
jgi:hypothetical protein